MKTYLSLFAGLGAVFFLGTTAQAQGHEVISNFYFIGDVVETPRELVIQNLAVGYDSSVFGPQVTTLNVLRSSQRANQPEVAPVRSLCLIYGAKSLVSYAAHDLVVAPLVLTYQEVAENSYDYFWGKSYNAMAISQVICRK